MSPVVTFDPPTPTTITAAEDAIVARLEATITGIEIAAFPDNPDTWRLTHQKGAALVRFTGATHGPVEDLETVVTERALTFEVVLQIRGLGRKGQAGAYQYLEAVRVALAGYQIAAFTPLIPLEERFIGQGEGLWTFAVRFRTTTVAVADAELDADAIALLTQITIDHPYAGQEIP